MKKIIISIAALLGVASIALNSCKDRLPQEVQEQFEQVQEQAKSKVSSEMKKALIAQIDEFLQSSDLEESLGFSKEQLDKTQQSITQYIENYDFDTEELTKLVGEVEELLEDTNGLAKDDIQKKLDELLEK